MFGSGGGRIVSPCPPAHSTSNEPHVGQKKRLRPSFHSLHDGAVNTPALPTLHSPLSLILNVTPGFDPVALDVYDVYTVNNHGAELKAKAPPSIGYAMFWI